MSVKLDKPIEEWVELYKEGKSIREIANMYNSNKGTVSYSLKKAGVELRKKSSIYIDGMKEKIIDGYLKGLSINQLYKKYKIGFATIKNMLTEEGIPLHKNRKYEHLVESFIEEYNKGHSLKKIEDKYGVSKTTISNYLKDEGWKLRSYELSSRLGYRDDNYFENISDKLYDLGVIYATSTIYKFYTSIYLNVKIYIEKEDEIFKVLNKFTEKSKNNYEKVDKSENKVIRVNSSKICDDLYKIGLDSHFPKNINNYKEFMDGYLAINTTIKKKYIYIKTKYIEDVKEYLKSIGIEQINCKKSGIYTYKKGARKLIEKHPMLRDEVIKIMGIKEE